MTPISFYFDEMMKEDVAKALVENGVAVVMAKNIGMVQKKDEEHLLYAHEHQLVLVTLDRKFAGLTSKRQDHSGLICWTPEFQDPGHMLSVFITFAKEYTTEQVAGNVYWLK